MFITFGQDEPYKSPKKAYLSHVIVIGIYFLSFFYEHPVYLCFFLIFDIDCVDVTEKWSLSFILLFFIEVFIFSCIKFKLLLCHVSVIFVASSTEEICLDILLYPFKVQMISYFELSINRPEDVEQAEESCSKCSQID